MTRSVGILSIYLAVVVAPLGLAWLQDMPPRSFRQELASGTGMLAFAFLLTEFVLSGRFKTVSGTIGLDVTIRFHQLVGRAALALALVHPFLYVPLPGPLRPWDPTRELTLTTDLGALAGGIGAFVLLPGFVLAAIHHDRLGYRYENWRWLHGLGALLLAGLLWHHTINAGRYGGADHLVWYWTALTGIAVFSLAHVYVVRPLYQLRHPWRVSAVERLCDRHWRVAVRPYGHDGIAFRAGQFVWLNIGHSPFSLCEHPFSISSAPDAGPELEFVVKELGDFTRQIGTVKPGTRAYVDGPHGTLSVAGRNAPGIALIAGGVGLAPMMGILRDLEATGDPRPAALIYANRVADQILFPEELARHARRRNMRITHVLSDPPEGWTGARGFVSRELLESHFDREARDNWVFVLCGPPAMLTALETALLAMGVAPDRILVERFHYD